MKNLIDEIKKKFKPLFNRISNADKSLVEPSFWELFDKELTTLADEVRAQERKKVLAELRCHWCGTNLSNPHSQTKQEEE